MNACIVAAHPDDEILWFSSLLGRVSRIVVCYLDHPVRPRLGAGRRAALARFPLAGLETLDVEEADVYDAARWPNPEIGPEGVVIGGARGEAYRAHFTYLVDMLGSRLAGYDTVFTHNPWGEYGHEEHIQVYRAVRRVQQEQGFQLWCSGYVGSRSHALMARCLDGVAVESMRLATQPGLAAEMAAHYKENGVWTWFDDYRWPEQESFLRLSPGATGAPAPLPLTYLPMGLPPLALADRSLRQLADKALRRRPYPPV